MSIAACLYYERQATRRNYVSTERHALRTSTTNTKFTSTFEDSAHAIVVESSNDGYVVTIDNAEPVSYPKANIADAVLNMNGDIVQPIQLTNNSVKIQFEGTIFTVPMMPSNAFEAERLMPEKPKEVCKLKATSFSLSSFSFFVFRICPVNYSAQCPARSFQSVLLSAI